MDEKTSESTTEIASSNHDHDEEKPLKLFQIKLLAQTVALDASVFYTNF